MEGAEVVDLTEDSFEEHREGGQTISDEDFAKRLQMEEYETLRASDFLVAQKLQVCYFKILKSGYFYYLSILHFSLRSFYIKVLEILLQFFFCFF